MHAPCREFAKLVEANAVAKLPDSDFEVDPGLRDIIEAQIKQEEDAVRQVADFLFAFSCPCYCCTPEAGRCLLNACLAEPGDLSGVPVDDQTVHV